MCLEMVGVMLLLLLQQEVEVVGVVVDLPKEVKRVVTTQMADGATRTSASVALMQLQQRVPELVLQVFLHDVPGFEALLLVLSSFVLQHLHLRWYEQMR